jgi:serine/threonine-protein kinase RsbW
VDEATLGSIRLAVTEACTNAVVHAYVGAEPGTLTVSAELLDDDEPRTLRIVVTDDGRGIVPRLDSPGIGFGLPIIAQVAEAFELRSAHGTGGTEVCMRFSLSAVAAQ